MFSNDRFEWEKDHFGFRIHDESKFRQKMKEKTDAYKKKPN